ncbi:small, acid-soluble spore protein, alpha/beta type [Priestia flexa]
MNQMKYEIPREFGADTTTCKNGLVGGEITKCLVQLAEQCLGCRI